MEEMASLWSYQESVDEMRQKLLCATLEFEHFKAETNEELRKRNEYVCQLIQLLKAVSQERDEARDQLQRLLNNVLPSSANQSQYITSFPLFQNESPVLLKPTKAGNSNITESNSLSEAAVNYNSHGSSTVDSFFDAVSSPNLSNINVGDSNNNNVGYVPHQSMQIQDSSLKVPVEMPKVDHATLIINNLLKGKPLPQKGKFLQAVIDTPPLLQSLLVAGPLPEWRNPPMLPIQIPPFSMQKDEEFVQQKSMANLSYVGSSKSQNYVHIPCGSPQMSTTPIFNFAPSGSCLGASNLGYAGGNCNNLLSVAKRQRLQ